MIHPAVEIPLDLLVEQLEERVKSGLINKKVDDKGELAIYCYSKQCVIDKAWDRYTLMSRGLIISADAIVALPFPKFFNVFENNESISNLPFETFDKLDGSLIILFNFKGRWRCATKGSFYNAQTRWAENWLQTYDLDNWLDPSVTYLFEAIYRHNRIIVKYDKEELVLLSGYSSTGYELTWDDLFKTAEHLKWNIAYRYSYKNFNELVSLVKKWPSSQEGVVVRFANGHRLKIKSEEYLTIHRFISNLTPLTIWGLLQAGNDLLDYKQNLPEEFWDDFNKIVAHISREYDRIFKLIMEIDEKITKDGWTNKEIGLHIKEFPEEVRRLIFPYRKVPDQFKRILYRQIRPKGNLLKGYSPSCIISRIQDEEE